MEPIPETSEAVDEFGPFEPDLLERLQDKARHVRELVPACVGLSLASREHGVTFTVVATDEEIAALDGAQYLDSGPCVESVKAEQVLEYTADDFFQESSWQLFALSTAAAGISSTLTLPILKEAQVVGSVNLYAASPQAFTGHHEGIAEIFHAWAPAAVANADLGFATRGTAQQAPQILREVTRIKVAVGVLVESQGLTLEAAEQQLSQAARRAGVSEAALAERIISGSAYAEREEE
ncbi:GAF and ANTAR domain-containing protein [Nocardioides sp.]|uniref:GAF and ANTAR domain-containing protein n=1 Tax=Nocardioides sp. TaxID=35761 RepID=UPI002BE519C5|nr:GAF and ANTAR domain-containing protein [Nocardioides sp.]HXH79434.1 GAF and ANTAR domain-containing protein [Nocardioides sp.]